MALGLFGQDVAVPRTVTVSAGTIAIVALAFLIPGSALYGLLRDRPLGKSTSRQLWMAWRWRFCHRWSLYGRDCLRASCAFNPCRISIQDWRSSRTRLGPSLHLGRCPRVSSQVRVASPKRESGCSPVVERSLDTRSPHHDCRHRGMAPRLGRSRERHPWLSRDRLVPQPATKSHASANIAARRAPNDLRVGTSANGLLP